YSKRGKSIRVSLKRNESGAVLEFHNYGILISDKKKIFKRYHRENEARGGYGIGLSFVYEICKEYGIGIKVLSSLKKGNSFIYAFNCIENGTIKN
ncbi:MAG: sensor histidine kinase, partial [Campylobacterales bacterium]|nr:sensor histidine kinase [Campylobacterales bacterium]